MLQQTQVATVQNKFQQFLDRFPTIRALAAAEESDVLHAWQGLGYYRRARNLHQAARQVVAEFNGVFPIEPEQIRQLPGLGRYTANAIACFAHGTKAPILEANTVRLWSRVCAAEGNPAAAPLNGQLWELAATVLPARRVADFNQALMDLGSAVCTASDPACSQCPIASQCVAHRQGTMDRFPQKAAKPAIQRVEEAAVVLFDGDKVLVRQRPGEGRWANLWEFPRAERMEGESWEATANRALREVTSQAFRLGPQRLELKHGIMHYRVLLKCYDATVAPRSKLDNDHDERLRWVALNDLELLPFSSPQRRIAATLQPLQFRHRT